MARTRELVAALTRVPGVRSAFTGARFHEAVLLLDRPVAPVLEALAARGIDGGFDLSRHYPELGPALLVCATETQTAGDIERYARWRWPKCMQIGARRLKRNHHPWHVSEPLIFELLQRPARGARGQWPAAEGADALADLPRGAAPRAARRRCPK